MVTMLRGTNRVFRLRAEGGLADAVVLAVYARPGRGHHGSLWTAGPVAAVTAGRLEDTGEIPVSVQYGSLSVEYTCSVQYEGYM